ncbi:spermidine synthase [Luteitalea sp.]|jgi:spermidine synthase|uniref:spermine/spermidine synthase domain-containing protein n=1 Tax=Luteitalea sp. TaxID=2004800 RepID=UPI0037CBCBCA
MVASDKRGAAWPLFLISFLVLFLEVALIRWMPAYIRLLAYFSNFILLASFLGIGIGCLLAPLRTNLLRWFPLLQAVLVIVVAAGRIDIAVPQTSESIYFSSGTTDAVVPVEGTWFLPLLCIAVAALFVTLAQRLGREMNAHPPLRAYLVNLAGSLAGVVAFGVVSALQLPPVVWFGLPFLAAVPFLLEQPKAWAASGLFLLSVALGVTHELSGDTLWSPYYKITAHTQGKETVVEVNNIFHQSMAPVREKEYFYQWPYTVFGDTFEDVLVLGAGSGTDVSSALQHGAKRVDAVEIDPVIVRLGRQYHPEGPYKDPRVTVVNDDARHYLRTAEKQYDLIVFALIDSLTLQSSFSAVRLESFMFTEEAFRAARERLKPGGVLVVYNYFREKWLVDRLANSARNVFGEEPKVHIHKEHGYLGVMIAGPGTHRIAQWPTPPEKVAAYNHPDVVSPGLPLDRDASIRPATDDWPFLYMKEPHLPTHYAWALLGVLVVSVLAVGATLRAVGALAGGVAVRPLVPFFVLGAGFMILETKAITQFALIWGSTWVVASATIASVLVMAALGAWLASRLPRINPWAVGVPLFALLALAYALPIGTVSFGSLAAETAFYSLLTFSPVLLAGLLFSGSLKQTDNVAFAYGANLLGAMLGGVGEYLALVTGYRVLLVAIALCYLVAIVLYPRERKAAA